MRRNPRRACAVYSDDDEKPTKPAKKAKLSPAEKEFEATISMIPLTEEHGLYVYSEKGNFRPTMEDTHCAYVSDETYMYAVFDGHGGIWMAEQLRDGFAGHLLARVAGVAFKKGTIERCIQDAFVSFDRQRSQGYLHRKEDSGSTAVVLLRRGTTLVIANLGDSRAMICGNDSVVFSTKDHKPSNLLEMNYIEAAGGFVRQGRVSGMLATSRAFGNFKNGKMDPLSGLYKEEKWHVNPTPEVSVVHLKEGISYHAILACDGLWDVRDCSQISQRAAKGVSQAWCVDVVNEVLKESFDNVTVMAVKL